jgi:hypothetical protein
MADTVDFGKSEQYKLSIRIDADGFSFALFNRQGENITCVDAPVNEALSLTANLVQAFRQTEWLSNRFEEVNVLIVDRRFTLLPLEFFEDEQVQQLFYYNFSRQDNEQVCYNILKNNNAVVLFGIDQTLYDLFREHHPGCRFYAQASALIEAFTARSRTNAARRLYACLHSRAIDLYAFRSGMLLLANSFECRLAADRLYYILSVWQQLGFDPQNDELYLCGNLPVADQSPLAAQQPLPDALQQYIRQVYTLSPAEQIDLSAISQ